MNKILTPIRIFGVVVILGILLSAFVYNYKKAFASDIKRSFTYYKEYPTASTLVIRKDTTYATDCVVLEDPFKFGYTKDSVYLDYGNIKVTHKVLGVDNRGGLNVIKPDGSILVFFHGQDIRPLHLKDTTEVLVMFDVNRNKVFLFSQSKKCP